MSAILSKRINDLALPLCMAAMDACCIYLVAWLFSTAVLSRIGNIPVPSPVMLALLELAAWWIATFLLDRTSLPMGVVQGLTGVLGLGAAFGVAALTNPPAGGKFTLEWLGLSLFSIVVSLALWFIGGYRASEPPTFNTAYNTFRVGLIIIGVCALVTVILGGAQSDAVWAGVGAVAIWFFVWSLIALALGNREVVRRESGSMSTGSWGLVLFISVGGILLVGTATGAFGGKSLLELVQNAVLGVIGLIGAVIYAILYAVLSLVAAAAPKLDVNYPTPTPVYDTGDKHPPPGTVPLNDPTKLAPQEMPPEILTIATVILVLLVVLITIWLVSRGVKRTRRTAGEQAAEERESLGALTLLMQQIRSWLDRVLGRGKGGAGAMGTSEDDLAALQGKPEWSGTLSIRQIYARLQRLAANVGYPRAPQQTPAEYLRVLSTAVPDLTGDFTDITAAYLQARYGPVPASGPAVLSATNAWKRAEPVLKSVNRNA